MRKITPAEIKSLLLEFYSPVISVYRERGIQPFGRPLGIAFFLVYVLHTMMYVSARTKVERLTEELAAAEANAKFADEYATQKAQLLSFRSRTPKYNQKDNWLYDAILASAEAHGITLKSISSQNESLVGDFLKLQYTVMADLKWQQIGEWIATLESSKVMMKVTNLEIKKTSTQMGMNQVTIQVTTMLSNKWAGL